MTSAGRALSAPLMGKEAEPTVFELSVVGRRAGTFRNTGIPQIEIALEQKYVREPLKLADLSERDITAHFTRLTHRQYSVDLGAYPLGSCTMKYNPKVCDDTSGLVGFKAVHPLMPAQASQGWLELLEDLERTLCAITGMHSATLQPPAGAAGELTGLLIMRGFHEANGDTRSKVVIPDSAHGTNPASVTLGGYETVTVATNERGLVDVDALRSVVDDQTAGLMLTNPNTLGLFEEDILEITKIMHDAGALVYYDGANLNAILGKTRPGEMGFDIVHMNLHKTFAVPHGGGGPGAGPVAVTEDLSKFLPGPLPRKIGDRYAWVKPTKSIGRVHGAHGNALALVRALTYIKLNGRDGLQKISEVAVLNANWLRYKLRSHFDVPFDVTNMHEFVMSSAGIKKKTGVKAFDIAKRLLEYGFHSPTMYFPLIVDEALMIEPTETESPETLSDLADALIAIAEEAEANPTVVTAAPQVTPVSRVDEALAARNLLPTHDAVERAQSK